MILKSYPSVVVLIDRSGMPLLTLPSEEKFVLVSGLTSTVIALTQRLPRSEIDYIKTESGVLFVKPIDEKGGLLMLFENVKGPDEIQWIVSLFLNEVRDALGFITQGLITEADMEGMKTIYSNFISRLTEIFQLATEIEEKYKVLREIVGSMAQALIRNCSDEILKEVDGELMVDINCVRCKKVTSNLMLEIMKRCLNDITNRIKQIL